MNCGMIGTGTPADVSEGFGFDATADGYFWCPYVYGVGDIYTIAPPFSSNNDILFGQYYNGVCSGYVNGSLYGSNGFAPNTVPGPIQLGTRTDGQTRIGKLSEIVYVNRGLALSQQQQLEGYLAWKWGLQTNLPSNHPYRNTAPTVPLPTISLSMPNGHSIVLSWNDPTEAQSFYLLSAPTVTGGYTFVYSSSYPATNPYTNSINTNQQFFRLIFQSEPPPPPF
jgi:hypothetical protein